MIPGELFIDGGELELNPNRARLTLVVENGGDRPAGPLSPRHSRKTDISLNIHN